MGRASVTRRRDKRETACMNAVDARIGNSAFSITWTWAGLRTLFLTTLAALLVGAAIERFVDPVPFVWPVEPLIEEPAVWTASPAPTWYTQDDMDRAVAEAYERGFRDLTMLPLCRPAPRLDVPFPYMKSF